MKFASSPLVPKVAKLEFGARSASSSASFQVVNAATSGNSNSEQTATGTTIASSRVGASPSERRVITMPGDDCNDASKYLIDECKWTGVVCGEDPGAERFFNGTDINEG